nr:hypothetical protein Iba_chr08eCG2200 [Ipomoea batatas]GME14142.1 hypothetical protein Iba_scaffold14966CG0010 [Ipomoea batatas]
MVGLLFYNCCSVWFICIWILCWLFITNTICHQRRSKPILSPVLTLWLHFDIWCYDWSNNKRTNC